MRSEAGDKVRLRHILDAISELEAYIEHATFDDFAANSMMKFACIKQLEIIGEAASHIFDKLKQRFNEVEWPEIVGLRNILIHEYFGIDENIIWVIIKKDIPQLKTRIKDSQSVLKSKVIVICINGGFKEEGSYKKTIKAACRTDTGKRS